MFKDFHSSLPSFFHLFWKHVIIPAYKPQLEDDVYFTSPNSLPNSNLQEFKVGNM